MASSHLDQIPNTVPAFDEADVSERMHHGYIPAPGLRMAARHHEIHLSDFRRVAPEKQRTILRQPVETPAESGTSATTDEICVVTRSEATTPLTRRDHEMKLTTTTWVTLDGVMQGLGGPDEDRRGGFQRGGWAMPLFDDEAATFVNQVYQRADAFLFGRRTYEIFAGYWGTMPDPESNPIAAPLNTQPKYVASTTLTDPQWANTTVLSSDVAGELGELKSQRGGELQVHGSGVLIRWLLANHLVDEMTLIVCPVVIGQGTRLFPHAGPDAAFELVESRTTQKGLTIQRFRPAGRPEYETATPDPGT